MRSRAARLRLAAPVPGSVASACQHLRAVMHSAHPQVMQKLAKGARAHVMEARQKHVKARWCGARCSPRARRGSGE